jgi:hypothetical protein
MTTNIKLSALAFAALTFTTTALIAGNASAAPAERARVEQGPVTHGPIGGPFKSPARPPIQTIQPISGVFHTAPKPCGSTLGAPICQPGGGGSVPTTGGGGGGGFTHIPGPPVECLGEEFRCQESVN